VFTGDCVEVLKTFAPNSIDAVVCDPPYGLEFMGKEFDTLGDGPGQQAWHLAWAKEALRVLKPGGHLVAFGGTRTYHRLACALEDAGFEIRDSLMWIYGTGFPKSMDVGKALDKKSGAAREVVAYSRLKQDIRGGGLHTKADARNTVSFPVTRAASPEAKQWDGWGTALKPAHEPIVLARKPLEGTVAANVLKWGTGALNIDGCRVNPGQAVSGGGANFDAWREGEGREDRPEQHGVQQLGHSKGRWPANVVLDEEAGAALGTPSKFFYSAKTSKAEREHGCAGLPAKQQDEGREEDATGANNPRNRGGEQRRNHHPTVKPVALMEWLVRLVTPPGGWVLDPFLGSGTTGMACKRLGFGFVGVEREPEYVAIAKARISAAADL
jgi:site-specific DNA-methyltransferase (adenine-specific)